MFVLGGALFSKNPGMVRRLQAEAAQHRGVLVLLDPDPAGRQGRALLDEALGGRCRHAFVPGLAATAQADSRQAPADADAFLKLTLCQEANSVEHLEA